MTTAHRPTFDPARGKEALRGPAYHQRLMPAHTKLKVRKEGQGSVAETDRRDLRAQLLEAEAAHFSQKSGGAAPAIEAEPAKEPKRALEAGGEAGGSGDEEEDMEAKRRRVLAETRAVDADSSGSENDSSEEESDEEDEEAELMRELEKIKKERAAKKEQEEREKAAEEQEERERDIALGNPLLNPHKDFNVKRRWDDDVVFKNQARGTEEKKPKEFVNDLLRSDFHKRFMSRFVR